MVDCTLTPEWRLIPGFPDYEVSNAAVIRRAVAHHRRPNAYPAGYVMNTWISRRKVRRKDGRITDLSYLAVTLVNRELKKKKNLFVHRVVAFAFLGLPPSAKHEVAHGDGNRLNNHVDNLRWATGAENQADRVGHGTGNQGSKHSMSKLRESDIRTIRARGKSGCRVGIIARDYNVTHSLISLILSNKIWRHVV